MPIIASTVILKETAKLQTSTGLSTFDISAASDIVWSMYTARDDSLTATITKNLDADSDIAFTTDGTDGKYEWTVDDSDSTGLTTGTYWQRTVITLSGEPYKSIWKSLDWSK